MVDQNNTVTLSSKIDIAVAALVSAIKSYEVGDWVASTILGGAARQVLNDICITRGLDTTTELLASSLGYKKSEIHTIITESYNGMKHAERDSDALVEVSSAQPKALIIMAASDLARLNEPYTLTIQKILNFARSFN